MGISSSTPDSETGVLATLGGGCFWCLEAAFESVEGVLAVTSGYAGGDVDDPSYEEVCSGSTGHAEVVQVRFDPARISYPQLLDLFWRVHDPTQLNRQGGDIGTQYRSVIFVQDPQQRQEAEQSRARLARDAADDRPIVTEIVDAGRFYPAESHHQGYFRSHPEAAYCQLVIRPKLASLGQL